MKTREQKTHIRNNLLLIFADPDAADVADLRSKVFKQSESPECSVQNSGCIYHSWLLQESRSINDSRLYHTVDASDTGHSLY